MVETDLVGTHEIAQRVGVRPNTVRQWTLRYDDFPRPVQQLGAGRLWDWNDIEIWLRRRHTPMNTKTITIPTEIEEYAEALAAVVTAERRYEHEIQPERPWLRGWSGINWAMQMFRPGAPSTSPEHIERARQYLDAAGVTADEAYAMWRRLETARDAAAEVLYQKTGSWNAIERMRRLMVDDGLPVSAAWEVVIGA